MALIDGKLRTPAQKGASWVLINGKLRSESEKSGGGGPTLRSINNTMTLGGGLASRKLVARRTNPETISFSDSIANLKVQFRSIANSLSPFTGTASRVLNAIRSPSSQNIPISDVISRKLTAFRTNTENIGMTDDANASIAGVISRSINNTLSGIASGSVIRKLIAKRTIFQESGGYEPEGYEPEGYETGTGGIDLNSSATARKLFTATLSETISISDVLTRILNAARSISDSVSVSSLLSVTKGKEAIINGLLTISSGLSRKLIATRTIANGITLSDVLAKLVTFKRSIQFVDFLSMPGLVSVWNFEDNLNDSVGSNDGTIVGTAAYNASGRRGKAFDFDGSNYITVADDSSLNPVTEISFGGWYFIPSSAAPGITNLMKKDSQYEATIIRSTNTILSAIFHVPLSATQMLASYTPGQWNHIMNTWSRANGGKLYVNGVLKNSINLFDRDMASSTNVLGIGASSTGLGILASDVLADEIIVHGKEFTAEEVMAIYSHSFDVKFTSVITRTTPSVFRTISDVLSLTGISTRILSAIRSTSSSLSLPSAVAAKTILTQLVDDTLSNITGSVSVFFTAKRILTNTVSLPSLITTILSASRSISDTLTPFTGIATAVKARFAVISNSLTLTGLATGKGILKRAISESISVSGSVASAIVRGATIANTVSIVSTIARKLTARRTNTETVSLVDNATSLKVHLRSIAESLTPFSGTVNGALIQFVQIADSISLSDSASRLLSALRGISEVLNIASLISRFKLGSATAMLSGTSVTQTRLTGESITQTTFKGTSIVLTRLTGESITK